MTATNKCYNFVGFTYSPPLRSSFEGEPDIESASDISPEPWPPDGKVNLPHTAWGGGSCVL